MSSQRDDLLISGLLGRVKERRSLLSCKVAQLARTKGAVLGDEGGTGMWKRV